MRLLNLICRRLWRWSALVLFAWGLALSAQRVAADQTYIIKKHDTLSMIAHQFGVSPADLARQNGMSLKATLYSGRRLVIPSKDAVPSPTLTPAVSRAIQDARVRKGRWKYIVIHHSGTPMATVKGMDEYHRNTRHMENGLAYHFVIGNGHGMKDGEVTVAPRWIKQLDGGHLASATLNEVSIGICLVGNCDAIPPTRKQLDSLQALIEALRKRCGLRVTAVKTHQQINPIHTRCPGQLFDVRKLIKQLS